MSMSMPLAKFVRVIVNIDEKLFSKYEAGITSHFVKYLEKNHASALRDGQVDLDALGCGIRALRINYMKKTSADYSAQDSAAFVLSGHNQYTAEFMSVNSVRQMLEGYYNSPDSIENVYIKRSVTTGRLIPCVNQKFVESLLSEKKVTEGVEKQLAEIEAMLSDYETKQSRSVAFEQYHVASLIAEKTAEILMRRMNYSRAV